MAEWRETDEDNGSIGSSAVTQLEEELDLDVLKKKLQKSGEVCCPSKVSNGGVALLLWCIDETMKSSCVILCDRSLWQQYYCSVQLGISQSLFVVWKGELAE